jgi:hypothetical protein
MTPLVSRSNMIPVLMMTASSGGVASTQPSSTRTCSPGAVARGSAVIRLMSPCWPAHSWPSAASSDIAGYRIALVSVGPSATMSSKNVSWHPMPSAITRRNRRCRSAIVSWNRYSTSVMPGTADSGSSWSGYAVGNLVFSGCPAAIGADQLSISFQSGLSLDAAVSTNRPV